MIGRTVNVHYPLLPRLRRRLGMSVTYAISASINLRKLIAARDAYRDHQRITDLLKRGLYQMKIEMASAEFCGLINLSMAENKQVSEQARGQLLSLAGWFKCGGGYNTLTVKSHDLAEMMRLKVKAAEDEGDSYV